MSTINAHVLYTMPQPSPISLSSSSELQWPKGSAGIRGGKAAQLTEGVMAAFLSASLREPSQNPFQMGSVHYTGKMACTHGHRTDSACCRRTLCLHRLRTTSVRLRIVSVRIGTASTTGFCYFPCVVCSQRGKGGRHQTRMRCKGCKAPLCIYPKNITHLKY